MRAEDHLGEDAKGDETEEASHGATEECSGRHEVPVKSHVTKCVHELKPSSTHFQYFFLRWLRTGQSLFTLYLSLRWYNEEVCLRYSLPLQHARTGFG